MTLGIIDVGTNSIHLLLGVLGLNGVFHVVLKKRDLARLGDGGLVRNRLTEKAMRRSLRILRDYGELLRRCDADHVEAVATSAVRDASNGARFVEQARRLGVPLRVISGREEARLIYDGVVRAHHLHGSSLIITIGGGSAQVIHGTDRRADYITSLPLGGARLGQRFIRYDPSHPEEVKALSAYVDNAWTPVARALRGRRWKQAIVSSATVYQLMVAAHRLRHPQADDKPSRLSLTQPALRRWVEWLSHSTAKQRAGLDGIDPKRQDVLLPTAVALLSWMERCGVSTVAHRSGSLREGLIFDYLARRRSVPCSRPLTIKNLAKARFI